MLFSPRSRRSRIRKSRIAELQAEQRTAAAEVEQMDRMIAMCEEFTRYRVQAITESVNSKFRLDTLAAVHRAGQRRSGRLL